MLCTPACSITKIHTLEIISLISSVMNYAKTFQGRPDIYASQVSKPFYKKGQKWFIATAYRDKWCKSAGFSCICHSKP